MVILAFLPHLMISRSWSVSKGVACSCSRYRSCRGSNCSAALGAFQQSSLMQWGALCCVSLCRGVPHASLGQELPHFPGLALSGTLLHGPRMVCPVAGGSSLQGLLAAQDKRLVVTTPLRNLEGWPSCGLSQSHKPDVRLRCRPHLGLCPNLTNDCIVVQARLLWRVKVPSSCV